MISTDRIPEILQDFAAQLRAEIQRQAMAALNFGVGADYRPATRSSAGSHSRPVPGGKRDPAALEALQERVRVFIVEHPGLRIEQINKELGTKTKELALPIRKLLADKAIKATGQKRSTTYSGGATKTARS